MFKRLLVRFALPLGLLVLGIKSLVFYHNNEEFTYVWNTSIENNSGAATCLFERDGKHRGMTVYRIGRDRNFPVDSLIKSNIEWVAILPYFYQENETTAAVNSRINPGIWTRRDSMYIEGIDALKAKGVKVFLKPHLWLGSGWRSNINLPTTAAWESWFESYRATMLHYAKMAELTHTEMLCIGTELRTSISNQPERWRKLIAEIRQVYTGKLTYAANWDDELDQVTFWDELDYIGVQAYFPLTQNANPSLEQINAGWGPHMERLSAMAQKHNKQILFTEVGYKNQANSTIRPWEWGSSLSLLHTKKSNRVQQLAYDSLYQMLWNKTWFAGTYVWQWVDSEDFAIHGKPAQNTMAKWYGEAVN